MNPELLDVSRADAVAYAEQVLSHPRLPLAGWVRDRIDLSAAEFAVTRDYVVDEDGEWNDNGGRDLNTAPGARGTWPPGNLTTPLGRYVLPRLTGGRILVVANSFDNKRVEAAPREGDLRIVQRRLGDAFERYLLLPGPVRRVDDLKLAIWSAVGAVAAVGVISDLGDVDLPANGAEVTAEQVQSLLANPTIVFMRMGSYDGFLVWTRSER